MIMKNDLKTKKLKSISLPEPQHGGRLRKISFPKYSSSAGIRSWASNPMHKYYSIQISRTAENVSGILQEAWSIGPYISKKGETKVLYC